jgi:hypothetical protein
VGLDAHFGLKDKIERLGRENIVIDCPPLGC